MQIIDILEKRSRIKRSGGFRVPQVSKQSPERTDHDGEVRHELHPSVCNSSLFSHTATPLANFRTDPKLPVI